jgi:Coenzyme PQQ synthesis protein D (PqqD)
VTCPGFQWFEIPCGSWILNTRVGATRESRNWVKVNARKIKEMLIELCTVVKQSKHQVSCNLNDEVAILNLKSTLYFGLDGVGVYIWQELSEPRVVSELCKAVLDRFDVDEDRCHADVIEFLTTLGDAGLIDFETSNMPVTRGG